LKRSASLIDALRASCNQTCLPALANNCAIPRPMAPAPTMPIRSNMQTS